MTERHGLDPIYPCSVCQRLHMPDVPCCLSDLKAAGHVSREEEEEEEEEDGPERCSACGGRQGGCGRCVKHGGRASVEEEVNHPAHYGGDTTYEAIKVIEAWGLGFCLGNAVKYIARAGKKDDLIKDLQKARWYLDREIKRLETK